MNERNMSIGFSYHEAFPKDLCRSYFLFLQDFIQKRLGANNEPFWVARMSGIESAYIGAYLHDGVPFSQFDFREMQRHSGICVWGGETDWKEFVERTMEAMTTASFLAIWDGGCYQQCQSLYAYMQERYPSLQTIPAHALEPYLYMYLDDQHTMPDSAYRFPQLFAHKKVLIVTSHGDSVRHQHQHNRQHIFHPYTMFDESTDVQVYKCSQQNGLNGDGYGWKGHFLKMCHDISQYEFDVAFIGCGGFSNLLGHYIHKEMGRSAVYLGGPVQLFFGVMGRRWFGHPQIRCFLERNGNHWIQPLPSDVPREKDAVDHGCYWV